MRKTRSGCISAGPPGSCRAEHKHLAPQALVPVPDGATAGTWAVFTECVGPTPTGDRRATPARVLVTSQGQKDNYLRTFRESRQVGDSELRR